MKQWPMLECALRSSLLATFATSILGRAETEIAYCNADLPLISCPSLVESFGVNLHLHHY
jgi:hypothetical protein